MKLVVQRVKNAAVYVEGKEFSQMPGKGILAYFAVKRDDTLDNADWLADKLLGLRMFEDEKGKMNLSVKDVGANIMIVPAFTLYGNCSKGKRPGFDASAPPEQANELFEYFIEKIRSSVSRVFMGKFRSHMEVHSINDGPVTFIIEK